MDLLSFNFFWMLYNLYLAVLPVIFSKFIFKMPNKFFTAIVGVLWFLYLPNTIYVFTDLQHLVDQWPNVSLPVQAVLVVQYGLLELIGLICFLVAYYPIEIILRKFKVSELNITRIIIAFNFVIGFAMVLGRIERVNSWDAVLNPVFVIISTLHMLESYQLIILSILLGLFTNFFYFLFRDKAKMLYQKWVR